MASLTTDLPYCPDPSSVRVGEHCCYRISVAGKPSILEVEIRCVADGYYQWRVRRNHPDTPSPLPVSAWRAGPVPTLIAAVREVEVAAAHPFRLAALVADDRRGG